MLQKLTEKDDKQFAKLIGLFFLFSNIGLAFLAAGLMYLLVITNHVG